MPVPSESRAATRRWFAAVLCVAVAARVTVAMLLGDSVSPLPGIFDQVSYHTLAIRVLEGHGFSFGSTWWPATAANAPTAHWSFPYVLYLAGVYGLGGPHPVIARILQALVVGVLHPWLTYRIATRLFGARVGLASAAIVAVYAYFIYYAAALLTESFYLVAILWSVDTALALADGTVDAARRRALWRRLGFALAVAVLLRQVVAVIVPVVLFWAWWHDGGRRRASAVYALGALFIIIAAVVPWTARNYVAFHRFVPLNTNAGFAFYWGNHPIHGSTFVPILPDGTYAKLIPSDLNGLNEAAMDRELMRRGLEVVRADPARFVRLSASRLKEYVKFWPSYDSGRVSNWARVLSFGLCLPLILAGTAIAATRPVGNSRGRGPLGRPGVWLLLAVAGVYGTVHLLSWTLIRYRLPVDAVMMPFAGLAAVACWDLARAGRRGSGDATGPA